MWNLIYGTNEPIYKTETNSLIDTRGREEEVASRAETMQPQNRIQN